MSASAAVMGARRVGSFFIFGPKQPLVKSTTLKPQVIMIFGWVNGQMKYVSKYAEYYQDRGHTVLLSLSTSRDFFLPEKTHLDNDVRLLDEFGVLQGGKSAAVVHAFSNGGTVKLHNLTKNLHAAQQMLITKAIILDSTPGTFDKKTAIIGLTDGLTGISRRLAEAGLRITYFFDDVKTWILGKRDTPVERAARNVVSSRSGPLKGPRLYIYSKADAFIDFRDVEEYQNTTRRGGDVVHALRFEDSDHVKHAVKYPRQYWSEVDRFLSTVE
ncbi:hypothetical protein HDU67_003952 [Dinochytrium kinnereticum]|nr:hypothetical protein HDU67_003952 [Dinochytrium kinnereticum]